MSPFVRTSAWLFSALLLILALGCKKSESTVDPLTNGPGSTTTTTGSTTATTGPPSIVGNWTMTALTFSPAWTVPSGNSTLSVPDYMPYLKLTGETCLTDVTVTFAANGTLTTNRSSLASCTNSPNSNPVLDFLFGPESTYTETDNQVVIYGKGKVTSQTFTKSGTNNVVSIAYSDPQDFSNRLIRTTYTFVFTKK